GPATSFSFTLDTTAPAAPTVALSSDTGSSNSDHITRNGALNVSGVESGASVQYSINGGSTWSSSFGAVEGANNVQVRQSDVAGNNGPATSFSFTLDTTAPAAPTVALSSDTGSSNSDHITRNGALTVSATAAGVTHTFSIDGSAPSSSYTKPTVDGSHTVMVTDTDLAGNASTATITFTLADLVSTTGTSGNDTITLANPSTGTVNLLAGTDKLTLSSAGDNALTVSNTETIIGGTANDAITLGTAQISGLID